MTLNRRSLLNALVSTALCTSAKPLMAVADDRPAGSSRRLPWRNWSGSQQCYPQARKAPATVEELQQLVAQTSGVIRPVGAGHSFTALVPTDDTIVSLARLSGLAAHDEQTLQATVYGGSRLGDLGQPLQDIGQALVNMPDIDEQSLAGCLGTATHGTGADLQCMSAYVTGLQLVDAKGDIINCDQQHNADIFHAARVSLGALGIITQITLQNQAPYRLRRETQWREFDEIVAIADDLADSSRNFEFYYIPFSGMGFTDVHNITDEPLSATEKFDGNDGIYELKQARDWLQWSPKLRELILSTYIKSLNDEVSIAPSWQNYASERNVRFNEMEYHLPREHGLAALKEIRAVLEKQFTDVFLPIEFRYVGGDEVWLSPFYRRPSCSIAVHRFFEEDFKPYFAAIEPIFRKYQGRPHWGKLNTLSQQDFQQLYPKWDDFKAVRQQLDPEGRFLNPYLRSLFV